MQIKPFLVKGYVYTKFVLQTVDMSMRRVQSDRGSASTSGKYGRHLCVCANHTKHMYMCPNDDAKAKIFVVVSSHQSRSCFSTLHTTHHGMQHRMRMQYIYALQRYVTLF